jgi:hypothetical protein
LLSSLKIFKEEDVVLLIEEMKDLFSMSRIAIEISEA